LKAAIAAATMCLSSAALLGCPTAHTETPSHATAAVSAEEARTWEAPPSDPLARSIRDQVERNWNLGSLAGADLSGMVVQLRLELLSDGTVTKVEIENYQPGNATFRQVAESAMRAVKVSSPLKLPPASNFRVIHLRFHPDETFE
jgi:hypothetical protein